MCGVLYLVGHDSGFNLEINEIGKAEESGNCGGNSVGCGMVSDPALVTGVTEAQRKAIERAYHAKGLRPGERARALIDSGSDEGALIFTEEEWGLFEKAVRQNAFQVRD